MNGKHSSPQSAESQTGVRSIAFRAAVAQHTAYTIKQATAYSEGIRKIRLKNIYAKTQEDVTNGHNPPEGKENSR